MVEGYGSWSVVRLWNELRERGARVAGRKEELVKRLEDYEKMQLFMKQSDTNPEPDFYWPSSIFQSVSGEHTSVLPPLPEEAVEIYVSLCQGDVTVVSIKSGTLLKALKLWHHHIAALSFCREDNFYFSGHVLASMKKRVSYSVKLIVLPVGEVKYASCKCAEGRGLQASCKHICCVALAIISFKKGDVGVRESCTQQLQAFHHPAKRSLSPVKVEQLGGKIPAGHDDPKQPQDRNNSCYREGVNIATVAFCYDTDLNIAMRDTFGKADVLQATKAHDYLKMPITVDVN